MLTTTRQEQTPNRPALPPAATELGAAEALSRMDPPMVVVTTATGDAAAGCLVEFSAQVSMDPLRYLVAISPANATFRVACAADRIAVHTLGRGQLDLARLFGEHTGDEMDKFDHCSWSRVDGVPVLDAVPSWFVGRVLQQWPLGDHVGFLLGFLRGSVDGAGVDGAGVDGATASLSASDVEGLSAGHDA
ncbi:flavin reductase family protein [Rhodococcus sp. D2-41]|uniref:flavin reductase family protein n=1 Tax=Speluncibacter jeojiensis TaxID=2710754 RepID=UPI00240E9D8A|nr:flavin reductase family protein [Rhodococcus sp. D2-41]MDG3010774.1 flavin reductase family protein [Rhodococcus sp. D2-41]